MKVHRRVGGAEGSGRKPKTDWTTEVTTEELVCGIPGCYNIQVAALQ